MKFREDILNGFKVTEQTRFCLRTATYKIQRALLKIHKQVLWFVHSACRHMVLNICMKFLEDILKGFIVIVRTRFCHRNCYFQSSKGHNSKNTYPSVTVLARCTSINVG